MVWPCKLNLFSSTFTWYFFSVRFWSVLSLWMKSYGVKPRANGCNIVGCYMLCPFAHPVACCWMLLCVVAQSLKPVKLFSPQLPTFFLFRDRRSVAQQCWIRLHSSFNIVGATHAHYAWFTKTYGLYWMVRLRVNGRYNSQHVSIKMKPLRHYCHVVLFISSVCSSNLWVCGWRPVVRPLKWHPCSSTFRIICLMKRNCNVNFSWILILATWISMG